jgi:hypothetical protein
MLSFSLLVALPFQIHPVHPSSSDAAKVSGKHNASSLMTMQVGGYGVFGLIWSGGHNTQGKATT